VLVNEDSCIKCNILNGLRRNSAGGPLLEISRQSIGDKRGEMLTLRAFKYLDALSCGSAASFVRRFSWQKRRGVAMVYDCLHCIRSSHVHTGVSEEEQFRQRKRSSRCHPDTATEKEGFYKLQNSAPVRLRT